MATYRRNDGRFGVPKRLESDRNVEPREACIPVFFKDSCIYFEVHRELDGRRNREMFVEIGEVPYGALKKIE